MFNCASYGTNFKSMRTLKKSIFSFSAIELNSEFTIKKPLKNRVDEIVSDENILAKDEL